MVDQVDKKRIIYQMHERSSTKNQIKKQEKDAFSREISNNIHYQEGSLVANCLQRSSKETNKEGRHFFQILFIW